jgi:hypothetical protein
MLTIRSKCAREALGQRVALIIRIAIDTELGIETPRRRMMWHDGMVARVFEYASERKPRPWAGRQAKEVRRLKHSDLPTLLPRPNCD